MEEISNQTRRPSSEEALQWSGHTDHPNIVLIHTDQQAVWTVGAHGGDAVSTPNIDRIAAEGVTFANCHTVCAVCTPSRGCMMTGRYPHQHGACTNNVPLDPDVVTWAQMLHRGGYDTGYVGKWHLDGPQRPGFVHPSRGFGFTDTRHMFNRGHWKRMWDRPRIGEPGVGAEVGDEREYTTDWLTGKAIEFISADRVAPFALMLSIPDPHTPFIVREPYASMFDPVSMPDPATWRDSNLPGWATEHEADWKLSDAANLQKVREWRAAYLGMVAHIDDNVGRLLAHLDQHDLTANTLVVFTSDHGEYLGEHGLMGKNLMYRSAYHVPCAMRLPNVIEAGTRVEHLVTQNDFAATLCGIAGVDAPPHHCGRDLRTLLTGKASRWRNEVHQHHPGGKLAGLLTPRWHLILHAEGEHRLFDLVADPNEMSDCFADPARAGIVEDLADRIMHHHEDTGSPAAKWLRCCRLRSA